MRVFQELDVCTHVALLNKHAKGLFKGKLLDLVDGFVEITGDVTLHPASPCFPFAFLLA